MEYDVFVNNEESIFGHNGIKLVDNPAIDFFENGDRVRLEFRAANFALDEIINWSDYTSETQPGPNNVGLNYGYYTLNGEHNFGSVTTPHEFADNYPGFIDLPRTFVVFVNQTKERQFAFEVEDIVRPMDSDA